jgi:hypothetical protein
MSTCANKWECVLSNSDVLNKLIKAETRVLVLTLTSKKFVNDAMRFPRIEYK